ncbi:MAG: hypothetical protein HY067_19020 [Betaproteobacteria bacterium]|nr:hypothetical protein [Betaproteobacteria bacterium]
MRSKGAVPRNPARQGVFSGVSRRFLTAAMACAALWAPSAFADLNDIRFRFTSDATYDDNISRARKDDKLYDSFGTLNLGASLPWQLSGTSRLVLNANVGGEKFKRYSGLDRLYANLQGELQYRNSGRFSEPIWGIFVRQGEDWYDSNLRDGYRTSAGLSVRKPVTDRIFFFSALAYNQRDGRSAVFDTKEVSVRANVDYSLSQRQTLYFGFEARDGDIVSTARSNLAYFDIAKAVIQDDVFTDTTRFSYRLKAYTGIATIGYNFALGEHAALDLAYRAAYSRPHDQPPSVVTTEKIDYVDNQVTLSILIRF